MPESVIATVILPIGKVPLGCPVPRPVAPGADFLALGHLPVGATMGVSAGHSRFFSVGRGIALSTAGLCTGHSRLLGWHKAGSDFWGGPDPWPDWRVSKGSQEPFPGDVPPDNAFLRPSRQTRGAEKVRPVPWGARPWGPPATAGVEHRQSAAEGGTLCSMTPDALPACTPVRPGQARARRAAAA